MRRMAAAVFGGIALAGQLTLAHHGYENFFRGQRVSIEGVLEEITYANPHVVLKIRTDESTTYTALWEGIHGVERRGGVTRETLKVGDRLVVTGSPNRDPSAHELALLREVRRPSDGWRWRTS
jgi:hypothetical protein